MNARGVDPRPGPEVPRDVRPVVVSKRRSITPWLFGGSLAFGAVLLFTTLNSRRQELTAPPVKARAADRSLAAMSPPPLYVPPAPASDPGIDRMPPLTTPVPSSPPTPQPVAPPKPPVPEPITPPTSLPTQSYQPAIPETRAVPAGEQPSPLVIDMGAPRPASPTPPAESGNSNETGQTAPATGALRVRAARFRKRSTTIAQGTLIPAVLETALDSTRPGQARALVSRDVHGYGGSRVLIPRGSRLYGEYRSDLSPGQNRAFVQWSRLVRPDGVTIAIDSPAADSLGRSGIRGSVNSHFFERFGSALLQSSLNIATSVVASRVGDNQVIVALPNGSLGAVQQIAPQQQVQPTLKVRQGARISVFVARDLDFTAVERR